MRSVARRRACPEPAEGMVQKETPFARSGASFETRRLRRPPSGRGVVGRSLLALMFPPDLLARAAALIARYRAAGLMAATAESCTGGLIAGLLTEIPGSSNVLERGFVVYSNAAKEELLGVPAETLERHGAVSEETARAMAEGRLRPRAPTSRSASPASPGRTAERRRSRSASSISPARGAGRRRSRGRSGSATSAATPCASPRSGSGSICWRRRSGRRERRAPNALTANARRSWLFKRFMRLNA